MAKRNMVGTARLGPDPTTHQHMRTLTTPQRDILHIGDKVLHKADGQDFTGELIDIDLNQLHGLVRYEGEPHDGEEQWIPADLLSQQPAPVVEPLVEVAPASEPAPEPAPDNPS